jgi:membrane protein YqaA with SNARE-associated domain
MGEDTSLWALFTASLLAATLLPGGSEFALVAVLRLHPDLVAPSLAVATLGNTLGGLSSYAIGRILPLRAPDSTTRAGRWQERALAMAQRYGSPALLAAWVPFVGDPLCVVAGWLRLPLLAVTAFMAVGKLARYLVIAWAVV